MFARLKHDGDALQNLLNTTNIALLDCCTELEINNHVADKNQSVGVYSGVIVIYLSWGEKVSVHEVVDLREKNVVW